jgi:TetR/AcrR family transcriptional regulator, transcriptional repressor of bet genes
MPGKREPEEVRRAQILNAAYEVATQEGIGGLTIRAVAARAGLSHGLIVFHFKSKSHLVVALLEWLLSTIVVLHTPEHIARQPRAVDRLQLLLQQEMDRLSREPGRTRLFLEFWALGARHASIRARISAAMERYRGAFREIVEEMGQTEPLSLPDATADGLAAVVVGWIHGCVVQAMIDPEHFDLSQYLTAVRGMIGQLAGPRT